MTKEKYNLSRVCYISTTSWSLETPKLCTREPTHKPTRKSSAKVIYCPKNTINTHVGCWPMGSLAFEPDKPASCTNPRWLMGCSLLTDRVSRRWKRQTNIPSKWGFDERIRLCCLEFVSVTFDCVWDIYISLVFNILCYFIVDTKNV